MSIINKIKKKIKNKEGNALLGFIFVAPVLTYCMIFLFLCGAYNLEINKLTVICSKAIDVALVDGQFTIESKDRLLKNLEDGRFDISFVDIEMLPPAAGDNNNDTYAPRGTEISLKLVYKKPHAFYKINSLFDINLKPESFYAGSKIYGMSEKN